MQGRCLLIGRNMTYQVYTDGKQAANKKEGEKTMERLRNKVVEVLEKKLGDGFKIIPKDKRKNNELILHGICIYKESDSVSPVIYLEDFIQYHDMWELNAQGIADILLETYHQEYCQDKTSRNVANYLGDFGIIKERVRIRLVNYAANLKEMGNIPHRKFLDLAITYYLDMESVIEDPYAFVIITNEWMERWGIAEDDLYRLGMGKLLAEDGCCITDMFSILRQIAKEEQDAITEGFIAEMEEDHDGSEVYVASNKKRLFGANCLMNLSILQELAEKMGCSLIIFPSSVHELVLIPQKNGSENCMVPTDVQAINIAQVPRDEWLSNSIYRYDSEKREVSIYKEGTPLL